MGSGNLPYHDIAHADSLISFGSDFLSTWGSPTAYAVAYGKFRSDTHGHRGTHVHFGARYSMTAANADKWVPIAPGAEGYAAMAMAWGIAQSHPESSYVQAITREAGPGALSQFAPDANAGILGIPPEALGGKSLNDFFHEMAHDYAAHHGLAIGGGGEAAAYSNGRFNASAVLMLNHVMGNVGHEGGLLPNPDGPISSPAPVPLVSLDEWRLIAADIANGATGLVIIHSADPVHGLPAGVGMADALRNENVAIISASPFIDDTSVMADLLIPDRVALEDWGDDTPNPAPGYQVYAVQQPVVNPLPDLDPRSFPDVLINAAAALGRADAMPAESYEATIRANVEETLGADLTETLKNGGWWDEGATRARRIPVRQPAQRYREHGRAGRDARLRQFPVAALRAQHRAGWPQRPPALGPERAGPRHHRRLANVGRNQRKTGPRNGVAGGRRGQHHHLLRNHPGAGLSQPRYAPQHRRRAHGRRTHRRFRIRHRPRFPREQQRGVHPGRRRQRRRRGDLERQPLQHHTHRRQHGRFQTGGWLHLTRNR